MGTVCGTQPESNCVCLTGSTVNPYMSKGSYCSVVCVFCARCVLNLPLCVCVRVSVSPHHSLLIRYGDVSMLQARMIKRNGLNVKPYRDQRK